MNESKRPLKVFLCHAHADRDRVHALYDHLTKDGVDVWLDEEKLLPGQNWQLEIQDAVHKSDVVIVCLSKQFNQKGFRQKEVKWAIDTSMELPQREIFIIPAVLEECDTPDELNGWHRVELFHFGGYEKLKQSLREKAREAGKSIPSQVERRTEKPTSSAYTPEKFVNRHQEIDFVVSMLRNPHQRNRAVVFEGERGTGKTWLSLHFLRTVFKEMKGVTSWLFSLPRAEVDLTSGNAPFVNKVVVQENQRPEIDDFLLVVARSLSVELPPTSSVSKIVESILHHIQTHLEEQFVLILDSAYESDWSLLEQLETHLLGYLLTLPNFFIIVTGRGRPYPWKIPYLIEAIRFRLGKFTLPQIREQLERFGLSHILSSNAIYSIGGGWPLFTELIAQATNLDDALEIIVPLLFHVVPRQERSQLRLYFEALCPLDGFGESEASLMVMTYNPKSEQEDGRIVCRKMMETHLVYWKQGRYVLDRSVQDILRQYLRLYRQNEWIRLNRVAYRHFQKQRDDKTMERFRPFFEKLMESHLQALQDVGADSEVVSWL